MNPDIKQLIKSDSPNRNNVRLPIQMEGVRSSASATRKQRKKKKKKKTTAINNWETKEELIQTELNKQTIN